MSAALEQALNELEHADAAVRLQAIARLRELGGLEAIPALVRCLRQDVDAEVRQQAAEASRWLTEQRSNPRDPYGIFGL